MHASEILVLMADWDGITGQSKVCLFVTWRSKRPHKPELGRAGLVDSLTYGLLRQDLFALFSIVPLITI